MNSTNLPPEVVKAINDAYNSLPLPWQHYIALALLLLILILRVITAMRAGASFLAAVWAALGGSATAVYAELQQLRQLLAIHDSQIANSRNVILSSTANPSRPADILKVKTPPGASPWPSK
jgi:hypothetical protein